MTLYKFKLLSLNEQANATWEQGVLLTYRHSSNFTVALFQIEGFYVEVYYNTIENEISSIRSFRSTAALSLYLDDIDISGLI